MGWTGTRQTRAQVLKELVAANAGGRCLASHETKDGLWSVWELSNQRQELANAGKRIITLDLIESRADGYQMVKSMDETMGPLYHDCPLRFLKMAKDFAGESYSAQWRERVKEHWRREREASRAQYVSPEDLQRLMEESHSDADPGL